uniref:ATP synthase F0 subunit 8 n=1 Tax=Orthaga disparoidalis TaxID=3103801 RepID=UPI002E76C9F8|nr:ATP synthase F0 subunit 8 [Orthaga disparoidalis]WQB62433.1 ATP synthase F0 subunit 8 [Orthaga disparoidalis]
MPQMMPINWMISFLFFISIFIMFNIMNYYMYNSTMQTNNYSSNKLFTKNFNWKW